MKRWQKITLGIVAAMLVLAGCGSTQHSADWRAGYNCGKYEHSDALDTSSAYFKDCNYHEAAGDLGPDFIAGVVYYNEHHG